MRIPIAVASVMFFIGCVASGPSYVSMKQEISNTPPDKARVVFYRTKETRLYIGQKAPIDIDDKEVGSLAYGGFFFRDISGGRHVIKTEIWQMPGKCPLVLNASAGTTYFFKVEPRTESYSPLIVGGVVGSSIEGAGKECSGAFQLTPVTKEVADENMQDLKLSD